MLEYLADLHARAIKPAEPPLPDAWEEIGPGYCYGPAFGHWDIVHQCLDALPWYPAHAERQLVVNLANQLDNGFLPGSIWMRSTPMPWTRNDEAARRWNSLDGHPPVWPVLVDELDALRGDDAVRRRCLPALLKQLAWFENHRQAKPEGFFYTDITIRRWESGVDEGVRFDDAPKEAVACVDATSHLHLCYDAAARWSAALGLDDRALRHRAIRLADLIRNGLWNDDTGFFHDAWSVADPSRRRLCIEGIWPLVSGAASPSQARRVIDEHLLSPDRFLTPHPPASVARSEAAFEQRMWRGPTWNSMTLWAARACIRYGRRDAAATLAGMALDQCARVFAETGTIWEFYHSLGGSPLDCQRKPHTPYNTPCRDYLGHAPLIALARLHDACTGKAP